MRISAVLLLILGCTGSPGPETSTTDAAVDHVKGPSSTQVPSPGPSQGDAAFENLDQGQQHPPLPADNPHWDWNAGGFVSDHGWYGEHSWADVRMRLAGHLSVIGRDRARLQVQAGDFKAAAGAYQALAAALDRLPIPDSGTSAALVSSLRAAAHRDHDLLVWLASDSTSPPLDRKAGLDGIRQEVLALERAGLQGASASKQSSRARDLQTALLPYLRPRPDLKLDGFEDFNSRHTLRVQLFAARMDSLDPLGFGDRWGYWRATEIERQALILGLVLGQLGGEDWTDRATSTLGTYTAPEAGPYMLASALGSAAHSPDQAASFSVEGLGWLPTGDSLIDVGAQPGPLAIGVLLKLDVNDPDHRPWLEAAVERLNGELSADPSVLVASVAQLAAVLDAYAFGSRYYNIKQLRNEAVRVLGRSGHTALALQVLQTNFPLHHQDWACPNRRGILLAIRGRLLAQGGQLADASIALDEAWKASQDFLALVTQAEAAGRGSGPGKRPPMPKRDGAPGPPPGR